MNSRIYLAALIGASLSTSAFANINLSFGQDTTLIETGNNNYTLSTASFAIDKSIPLSSNITIIPGGKIGFYDSDTDNNVKLKLNNSIQLNLRLQTNGQGSLENLYVHLTPNYSKFEFSNNIGNGSYTGFGVNVGAGYQFTKQISADLGYGAYSLDHNRSIDTDLDVSAVNLALRYTL